jgi:hypothetical protein
MVQTVTMSASGGRPERVAAGGPRTVASDRKCGDFHDLLRRVRGAPTGPSMPEQAQPDAETKGPRLNLQNTVNDEPRPGLAPEEQPSWGQGRPDPAEWLASINPGGCVDAAAPAAVAATPASPASHAELSVLVERWVKRIALGGDQRRGVARLDIGQGRFAGAELLVVVDAGQISVELSLPSHETSPGLGQRLRDRLERRGLNAEVTVR